MNLDVLLIGFNRSDLINKSLDNLSKFENIRVWIAIDGPRINNFKDEDEFNKIKKIINKFGIKKSQLKISEFNQGCRNGVRNAITWFFTKVEFGLILEDDIEIDGNYLIQISRWLFEYRNDKLIASISSHNSIGAPSALIRKNGLSLMPTCRVWGWATWREKWNDHIKITEDLSGKKLKKIFFLLPRKYRNFNTALTIWKCMNKFFDTWDYEWNFYHILKNQKSITPDGFHCLNHGYREDATHTFKNLQAPWDNLQSFDQLKLKKNLINLDPDDILIKEIARECGFPLNSNLLKEFLKLQKYLIKNKFENIL